MSFSPDGKKLASGSYDNTIILWDVETQKPIGLPLTGHKGVVHSVSFSPDGNVLASGGSDSTIILWDVETQKPIGLPFTGHKDEVLSVSFSPDGNVLASSSFDNTIIWDVNLESWKKRACHIANRNMTHEEWKYYMGDEPYRKTCTELPGPDEDIFEFYE